jgi:choline dehydrogenase-like flavoprotein
MSRERNDMAERTQFDVVIVGGGVCGALVAEKLTGKGKSVLVLEAGTNDADDPDKYADFLEQFYLSGPRRALANSPYPANPTALSPNDIALNPYFVQQGPKNFMSDYLRMTGGSTLHWQGTALRMVPNDFRMQSVYGQSVDWPISYEDLEPSYRDAEFAIGISGNKTAQGFFGITFPEDYDYPMEQMSASYLDKYFIAKLDKVHVKLYGGQYPLGVVPLPMARNTNPRNGYKPRVGVNDPTRKGGRCQGNSSCAPICPVQAKYSATKTFAAVKKEHKESFEIRPKCVASKLLFDPVSGRVNGVQYKRYTKPGRPEHVVESVRGTVVVLAANAIENSVLALASQVVDPSGQLGRNLMDHPYLATIGLAQEPVYPFRGPIETCGLETLRDGKFRERHASFRISLSNWAWPGEPGRSVASLIDHGVIGKELRARLQYKLTRMVRLGFFCEQLPDPNNRVTIDPAHTDILGNYFPIINYGYADYSLDAAVIALSNVWPEFLSKTGVVDQTDFSTVLGGFQEVAHRGFKFNLTGPGHLVGTHRMGRDRNTSVVDSHCRSWFHRNLYMVGTGSMVTIGTSNPTLTAAAISLRAADSMLQDLHRN